MPLLDDDLAALNAPLRPDERRWDEDLQFVLAQEMGFVAVGAQTAAGPAVA